MVPKRIHMLLARARPGDRAESSMNGKKDEGQARPFGALPEWKQHRTRQPVLEQGVSTSEVGAQAKDAKIHA
jgi:hypothetical protein